MPHSRHSGAAIVVYNPAATTAPAFPGAMIAPADAQRTHLIIQAAGFMPFTIYARSGSDPTTQVGVGLTGVTGTLEFNELDDPEFVVSEWWAYSSTYVTAFLSVTAMTYR